MPALDYDPNEVARPNRTLERFRHIYLAELRRRLNDFQTRGIVQEQNLNPDAQIDRLIEDEINNNILTIIGNDYILLRDIMHKLRDMDFTSNYIKYFYLYVFFFLATNMRNYINREGFDPLMLAIVVFGMITYINVLSFCNQLEESRHDNLR